MPVQGRRCSKIIRSSGRFLLDMLFPPLCVRCGAEGVWICDLCQKDLVWHAPCCFRCGRLVPGGARIVPGQTCTACRRQTVIKAFFAPFRYETHTVRLLIHAMKYRRLRSLDEFFAALLLEYLHTYHIVFPPQLLIVPIPLHTVKMRFRGFNQAACIAARLSRLLGYDYAPQLLTRIRATRPQVGLSHEERKANLAGVFAASIPLHDRLRPILLLDDVKTTGATLEEAARALKRAGAGPIWTLTIAR